jgi:hypothetical protein
MERQPERPGERTAEHEQRGQGHLDRHHDHGQPGARRVVGRQPGEPEGLDLRPGVLRAAHVRIEEVGVDLVNRRQQVGRRRDRGTRPQGRTGRPPGAVQGRREPRRGQAGQEHLLGEHVPLGEQRVERRAQAEREAEPVRRPQEQERAGDLEHARPAQARLVVVGQVRVDQDGHRERPPPRAQRRVRRHWQTPAPTHEPLLQA